MEKRILSFIMLVIFLFGSASLICSQSNTGMAKLNIFVSAKDDPCGLSNRTWYITIYNCDGEVLEWCGRRYAVIPAKCGHAKIEVPPGCYYIKGVWSFHWSFREKAYWVNHFTDTAIITATCGQTTCVKLFNPSAHRCGYIYVRALRDIMKQKEIKPELLERIKNAVEAIDVMLKEFPIPAKKFEIGHEEEIIKLLKEHSEKEQKE